MTADDDKDPDELPYKVYRSGGKRSEGGKSSSGTSGSRGDGDASGGRADGARPEYSVYRGSRNPLHKLKELSPGALISRLRDRGKGDGGSGGRAGPLRESSVDSSRPSWRRVLRWVAIGAGAWLLLSVILFAVSAQIQKGKLDDAAADELGAFPLLVADPQNILVIGTDARPEATGAAEAETRPKCTTQGATGSPPSADCMGFRADTLMVVRAGGGAFEKLSIPRDALADIPGVGQGKINSAYATGGAALQIQTVENFLGIDIDHAVLLDFEGFSDFIDAIGGVTVTVTSRLRAIIDGGSGQGGITLKLDKGEVKLDGARALAYARARTNLRNPNETDLDRARRQQQVLAGIKDRLTSPLRAPINFLRGPLIAWNAPKAMVTDMGAATLPQLALAMAIGGDSGTKILGRKGAVNTTGGNLAIPMSECERAVEKLLGRAGPEPPACSPLG